MATQAQAGAAGKGTEAGPCPCGSGDAYAVCCRPLLTGETAAASAVALMRSRYCAYVLGATDYILSTWAPATRPPAIGPDQARVEWLGLEIHGTSRGKEEDSVGAVEFSASYRIDGACFTLSENSRFIRVDGRWFYLDGQCETSRSKPGRNSPCPCGSGKKYKHCCCR